ncbi:MAG: hypothetical protein HYY17_10675 [Planctomycetes bacterium]|nr:hypothetical protein [Planctomycetota bacterium]
MELTPYVSVPASSAPLPVGAILSGIVKEILAANRYLIQIQALALELELPLALNVGDAVRMRVREASARALVLDVSLPDAREPLPARGLPERLGFPVDPETERLVRALMRMNAPIDRDRVESALASARAAKGEARIEAAAFLVAHGIDPDPRTVTRLARMAEPAPLPSPTANPVLRSMQETVAPVPEEAPAVVPKPLPSDEAVRALLDRSPVLRFLDRALEIASRLEPSPESGMRVDEALAIVRSILERPGGDPEEIRALRLPASQLHELRSKLFALERAAIASVEEFREARETGGPLFERFDRFLAHRVVNQLARLQDDGVAILQVSIRHENRVMDVPIRVIRREGGHGGAAGPGFHVVLDTDLSRLGPVRTKVDAAGRGMAVRFQVRRSDARRHLESGNDELACALRDLGWEPSVSTEVASPLPESPFAAFERGGDVSGIDVRV